ncbi:hypothetical protein AC578_5472 [Pseudocercospora eumusae]|uniref:Uncharacterized protein n=1 Tax=Pseudocercospora eumusae TaxID=321146 RepID=A0A139GTI6_9PEZI|nr:hypothetical protein AC578_5472 [Pseudocercospora eumusae]
MIYSFRDPRKKLHQLCKDWDVNILHYWSASWQFYFDDTPVRGIQIHFMDLDKRQVTKMIWEFNNAAARYAICKAGSSACPLQFKFTVGDNGPAHETANCQGLNSID